MKYRTGVLIGRFQPFHDGHRGLLAEALAQSERVVVILGSAASARTVRNPLRGPERAEMIRGNLAPEYMDRVVFAEVRDYFYNDAAWTNEVLEKVRFLTGVGPTALFGFEKDFSSSYLKWFPDWPYVSVSLTKDFSATPVRERFLRDPSGVEREDSLSQATVDFLKRFARDNPAYTTLREEQLALDRYRAEWAQSPYPPVFVTTDAVVLQAGHILLIRRGRAPGKGLWALPGGFLDPHERLLDGALRELREETSLDVASEALKSAFTAVKAFDHPLRSPRGRTITHAHVFKLPGDRLARAQAGDDAAGVQWIPLLDLGKMEDQFFEDHFHVIHFFLRNP